MRSVYNKIYKSAATIFVTSPAYSDVLAVPDAVVWHNAPLSVETKQKVCAEQNKHKCLIYCGYLRNHSHINRISKEIDIHLYGRFNQRSSDQADFDLDKGSILYFGEYAFQELSDLYSKYYFAYVNDHLGANAAYNLTNRLYESCLSGCIPVIVTTVICASLCNQIT